VGAGLATFCDRFASKIGSILITTLLVMLTISSSTDFTFWVNPMTSSSKTLSAPSFNPTYGYARQWGSFGGPSGPNGLALDPSGNVYVADAQNYAVVKMTKNGTFVAIWGSYGPGRGQFRDPLGIAVDSNGNLFVTDSANNNVTKFSSTGTILGSWNGNGTSNGLLRAPQGIAVNASGYVYIVDQGNQRVGIFRNNGAFVKYFGLGPPGNFTMPMGMAIDQNGSVYVDDANTDFKDGFAGNITKFTMNGGFVLSWGGVNSGGTLFEPQGLSVDGSGNVYVADGLETRVQKFSGTSQKLLLTVGSLGTTPGHFSNPMGVTVDNLGNIFVGDPINFNVQQFSSGTGAYIASLAYQRLGRLSTPFGSATDGLGNVYIVDQDNQRVQKFNVSSGGFVAAWGTPGTNTGQFTSPAGIVVDHGGNVYVADSNNNRVQKILPGRDIR